MAKLALTAPSTAGTLALDAGREGPLYQSDMLLIGLTGNIGSGKSSVSRFLADHGATIVDADVLARRAVEVDTPAYETIVERWGSAVLSPDGHLDRAALRRIVFADPQQLEELNRIVHPEVERLGAELIAAARARGDRVVVCDVPLLFERHMTDRFDRIVLVDADRAIRLERLVRDRGLRETEAMEMIAAQMPAELKRARADFIIDNNGSLAQLERCVNDVWNALVEEEQRRHAGAAIP